MLLINSTGMKILKDENYKNISVEKRKKKIERRRGLEK